VASSVVLDGPIATVSMNLALTAGGTSAPPPSTLTDPGLLENLRAVLSSKVRDALSSTAVRAETPAFSNLAPGSATVSIRVVSQGIATIPAGKYGPGSLQLADELKEPVCEHVSDLLGDTPQPTVTVTDSSVESGAAAKNATIEEGGEGALGLTREQMVLVRVTAIPGLLGAALFTLAVLGIKVPPGGQFACAVVIVACVVFAVAVLGWGYYSLRHFLIVLLLTVLVLLLVALAYPLFGADFPLAPSDS
jgi:hypothetical protein